MIPLPASSDSTHVLQENLLHRITNRIRQSLELQEVLQTTVTEIRAFLQTDRVMVYRFHPDAHGEVIAEAIDQVRVPALLGLHFPADDIPPQARELFLQARQRSIVDLSTQQIGWSAPPLMEASPATADQIRYRPVDPCHVEYLKAMGVQSSVVVPIVQQSHLWGLLVAHHSEPRLVSDAELHFLQLVVDQVTIAIAQSTLLAQVQAQACRDRIANRIATLLHDGSNRCFDVALKATIKAVGATGGRLFLQLNGANQLHQLHTWGRQPIAPAATHQPLESDALWQSMSPRQECAIADLDQDARCTPIRAWFQASPIRSMLIVPLQRGSEQLGYLTLFRDEIETETLWAGKVDPDERQTMPRDSFERWRQHQTKQAPGWTENDVALVRAIKTHFALAIAQHQLQTQVQSLNVRLQEKVQHQSRDLANIQFALDQSAIVAITDSQGVIGYVNDKFCETFGYDRAELIGRSHRLINSGYHPPDFFAALWQTISRGAVWRGEIKNRAKDGTDYWFDSTIVPLLDQQGHPNQYVAIHSDITARKQVEAALNYQSSLLHNVINSSTDWIFVKDLNFRHLLINQAYADAIARTPAEMLGQDDLELGFPPEQVFGNPDQGIVGFRPQDERAIAGEMVFNSGEPAMVADGSTIWTETRKFPLRDQDGQILGVLGVCRDITQRREAEMALQRTTQRLQEAQRVAQMGSWEFNVATGSINWSDELFRIFGLEPRPNPPTFEEHVQLLHPDDWTGFQQTVSRAVLEGVPYDIELRAVHPNGEIRLVNVRAEVITDATGHVAALFGAVIDITERKRVELALQQLTESLQKAQQLAHLGSWEYQIATGQITWSDETYRLYGLEPGQPVPPLEAVLALYHPDDRTRLEQVFTRTLQEGVPYDDEFRIVRSDGFTLCLDTKGKALRNEAGDIIGAIGTVMDITDRKRAEAQLKEQEQFLRSIYDGVEHAIFVVDVLESGEFHYVAYNAAAETLTGRVTADIVGKTPEEVLGEVEGAIVRQRYTQCVQAGMSVADEECLTFKKQKQWVLTTYNPLRNSEGRIYRIICTSFDITARKQAEEALHQKAEQEQLLNQLANQIRSSLDLDQILRTAVESMRDLLEVDRCTFVWFRPQATPPTWECVYDAHLPGLPSILGLYPSDSIGSIAQRLQNLEMIQDDDTSAIADPHWRAVLLSLGHKSNIAIPLQTNTGDIGVISCSQQSHVRPWQDSEVKLLIAVANQLAIAINQANLYKQSRLAAETAQAQAQQLEQTLIELRQTQSQLVQTEKMSSLGQLVAGVAHEINNPVNFIYGNLSYAGEYAHELLDLLTLYQQYYPHPVPAIQAKTEDIELDFLKADLPKLLSSMKVGADRIQQIVLALRNFSRTDEAEVKAVNIHEGIDSTLMILQSRLKETAGHPGIQVVKHYGELPTVECYAGQLNQVFMNILSNAIDALDDYNSRRSPEAQTLDPATITISTEQVSERSVQICIADNGMGMSEAVQRRLFEPFFTTKPVGKGTGLGLSISYQVVVDKHGGTLTCQSAPGAGTQFVIELPLTLKPNPA